MSEENIFSASNFFSAIFLTDSFLAASRLSLILEFSGVPSSIFPCSNPSLSLSVLSSEVESPKRFSAFAFILASFSASSI